MPAPWLRVSTGKPQDYRVLKIREDRVSDPRNGKEYPRVVIECADWVHIVALTRANQIVLIRQFRFGIWNTTLEVPGGIIEKAEEPAHAARRELEEETGYVPETVRELGFVHPNPAIQTNRCYTFLATGCERRSAAKQDEGEDISVELCPVGDLPRLIASRQITHALVVAGLCFAQDHFRTSGPPTG